MKQGGNASSFTIFNSKTNAFKVVKFVKIRRHLTDFIHLTNITFGLLGKLRISRVTRLHNLLAVIHFPKSKILTLLIKHGLHGIHLRDTNKINSGHAYSEHYEMETSLCDL